MHRRTLLATIGSATLGDGFARGEWRPDRGRPTQSCDDLSVRTADVEVDFHCDTGPVSRAHLALEPTTCDESLALEVVDGGEVVGSTTRSERSGGIRSLTVTVHHELPDEVLLRLRGSDGTVRLERAVSVDHYRNAPPEVGISEVGLDRDLVAVGEPIEATATVTSTGGETGVDLHLEADGRRVASVREPVGVDRGCASEPTTDATLSYAFDGPGRYSLGLVAVPRRADGPAASTPLGTVTVLGLPGLPTLAIGGGVTAGGLALWRRWADSGKNGGGSA